MLRTFSKYPLLGSMSNIDFINLVRGLLNEQDSQRVQDLAIRLYLNSAKSELHDKVLSSSTPLYDYIFHIEPDPVVYEGITPLVGSPQTPPDQWQSLTDVKYVKVNDEDFENLNNKFNIKRLSFCNRNGYNRVSPGDIIGTIWYGTFYGLNYIIPNDHVHSIKSIVLLGHGAGKEVSYEELMTVAHGYTGVWSQSFLWTRVGCSVLIYNGPRTLDRKDPETDTIEIYELLVVRKPLLDDLIIPNASARYTLPVDVPPDYYRILATMVQQSCLESLGKTLMPQLSQTVDLLAQGKNQFSNVNKEQGAK